MTENRISQREDSSLEVTHEQQRWETGKTEHSLKDWRDSSKKYMTFASLLSHREHETKNIFRSDSWNLPNLVKEKGLQIQGGKKTPNRINRKKLWQIIIKSQKMRDKENTILSGTVAHACNPIYSGGRDQEDHSLKPV
jgi:hypothetical protein